MDAFKFPGGEFSFALGLVGPVELLLPFDLASAILDTALPEKLFLTKQNCQQ